MSDLKTLIDYARQLPELKSSVPLLESFYLRCRILNLTSASMRASADRILYLLRYASKINKGLDSLTAEDLKNYVLSIVDSISPVTVNGRIIVYKTLFGFLLEENLISNDPAKGLHKLIEPIKIKKTITPEDMALVLSALNRKSFCGSRDFCMILLTYDSMLRLNELLTIKMADIDLQGRLVKLNGKGRKERYAPLSNKTARAVHYYLNKYHSIIGSEFLFPTRTGEQISRYRGHRIVVNAGKRVGIRIYPHLLRHSGASEFIRQGGNVAVLSRILGHSSLKTTEIYLHLSGQDLLENFDSLSPINKIKI